MRVLVTGMGGEMGTRVAQLLEARTEVDEIVGCDFVPPRRRLRRAEFRRINPHHRERLRDFVTDFAPTHVAHFGVYEPASRSTPAPGGQAHRAHHDGGALGRGPRRRARVRRGAERTRDLRRQSMASTCATVPDESVPPAPTSPFGASLLQVETVAAGLRHRHGIERRRTAVCAGRRFARAEPARTVAASAGGAGRRVRRPAVLAAASRRCRAGDGGGDVRVVRRSGERRRPGRDEPVAGGASRWPRAAYRCCRRSGQRRRRWSSSSARRSPRMLSSCCATAASVPAGARSTSSASSVLVRRSRCCRSCSTGPRSFRSPAAGDGSMSPRGARPTVGRGTRSKRLPEKASGGRDVCVIRRRVRARLGPRARGTVAAHVRAPPRSGALRARSLRTRPAALRPLRADAREDRARRRHRR